MIEYPCDIVIWPYSDFLIAYVYSDNDWNRDWNLTKLHYVIEIKIAMVWIHGYSYFVQPNTNLHYQNIIQAIEIQAWLELLSLLLSFPIVCLNSLLVNHVDSLLLLVCFFMLFSVKWLKIYVQPAGRVTTYLSIGTIFTWCVYHSCNSYLLEVMILHTIGLPYG